MCGLLIIIFSLTYLFTLQHALSCEMCLSLLKDAYAKDFEDELFDYW